jgi:hypothetical protein
MTLLKIKEALNSAYMYFMEDPARKHIRSAITSLEVYEARERMLIEALEGIQKSLDKNCGSAPGIRSNTLLAIAEISNITQAALKAAKGE